MPLKLVIIDTIYDLFSNVPQSRGSIFDNERNQILEVVFQKLREIAIEFNLLFILINGTSSNFGRNVKEEAQTMSEYYNW